jgi:uncharacterized protein YijF (DUF1287 family)
MRSTNRTREAAIPAARDHRLRTPWRADLPAPTDWLQARALAQVNKRLTWHKRYGVVRGPTGRVWTARGSSADVVGSHHAAGRA